MALENEINKFLISLKLFPTLKGYNYIRMAIRLVLEGGSPFKSFKYQVYPLIAQKYRTNVACVERNIINAIDAAWLNADVEVLRREFGYTVNENKGKPTSREFILMAADKMRLADIING